MIDSSTFFQYVDPFPPFEQDILNRVQRQIDMTPVFENVSAQMTRISKHFSKLQSDITTLKDVLQSLQFSVDYNKVLTSMEDLLSSLSTNIIEQCSLNINAFKSALLPTLIQYRSDFNTCNTEFQKNLNPYSELTSKTRIDLTNEQEIAMKESTVIRATSLYNLGKSVENSENATIPVLSSTLSAFIVEMVSTMNQFVQINKSHLQEINDDMSKNQSIVKGAFRKQVTDINKCLKFADDFWEIRLNKMKPYDEQIKPSGIVWLQAGHRKFTNQWTRKYISFKDSKLDIYDPVAGIKEQSQAVAILTVQPVSKKRRFTFKIQSNTFSYIFQALSEFDLDEWTSVFTDHNARMLRGDEDENTTKMKCVCADCGAHEATWCAINWCTTLCLKCSGIHRQMSTQTSRVRSIILDKLHPFIMDLLLMMRNDASDELLLDKHVEMEIGPRIDEQLRTIFIKRKYQRMDWATKAPVPDPFEAILQSDIYALYHALNFGKDNEKKDSLTVLHAAAARGDNLMATLACCCLSDIDTVDSKGWTPLCYAIFYKNFDFASFLLSYGSRPEKCKMDLFTLVVAQKCESLNDLILPYALYDPSSSSIIKPVSTEFAPDTCNYDSISVTPKIREMAANEYIHYHPSGSC